MTARRFNGANNLLLILKEIKDFAFTSGSQRISAMNIRGNDFCVLARNFGFLTRKLGVYTETLEDVCINLCLRLSFS